MRRAAVDSAAGGGWSDGRPGRGRRSGDGRRPAVRGLQRHCAQHCDGDFADAARRRRSVCGRGHHRRAAESVVEPHVRLGTRQTCGSTSSAARRSRPQPSTAWSERLRHAIAVLGAMALQSAYSRSAPVSPRTAARDLVSRRSTTQQQAESTAARRTRGPALCRARPRRQPAARVRATAAASRARHVSTRLMQDVAAASVRIPTVTSPDQGNRTALRDPASCAPGVRRQARRIATLRDLLSWRLMLGINLLNYAEPRLASAVAQDEFTLTDLGEVGLLGSAFALVYAIGNCRSVCRQTVAVRGKRSLARRRHLRAASLLGRSHDELRGNCSVAGANERRRDPRRLATRRLLPSLRELRARLVPIWWRILASPSARRRARLGGASTAFFATAAAGHPRLPTAPHTRPRGGQLAGRARDAPDDAAALAHQDVAHRHPRRRRCSSWSAPTRTQAPTSDAALAHGCRRGWHASRGVIVVGGAQWSGRRISRRLAWATLAASRPR